MKIDLTKTYQYRNGEPARVLCVDAPGDFGQPVVSINQSGSVYRHDSSGRWTTGPSPVDLIEVIPPWEGQLWVHPSGAAKTQASGISEDTYIALGYRKIQAKEVSQP